MSPKKGATIPNGKDRVFQTVFWGQTGDYFSGGKPEPHKFIQVQLGFVLPDLPVTIAELLSGTRDFCLLCLCLGLVMPKYAKRILNRKT